MDWNTFLPKKAFLTVSKHWRCIFDFSYSTLIVIICRFLRFLATFLSTISAFHFFPWKLLSTFIAQFHDNNCLPEFHLPASLLLLRPPACRCWRPRCQCQWFRPAAARAAPHWWPSRPWKLRSDVRSDVIYILEVRCKVRF